MAATEYCINMYRMRPLYNLKDKIPLPDVMYPMTPAHALLQRDHQQGNELKSLETRQLSLLRKLDSIIGEVSACLGAGDVNTTKPCTSSSALSEILRPDCPADLVIRMTPTHPLRWLSFVKKELEKQKVHTWWKFHTHSSVPTGMPVSDAFPRMVGHENRYPYQLIITVIYNNVAHCPSLHVSPCSRTPVCGESNILRFFARLLGVYDNSKPAVDDVTMDLCMDICDIIMSPTATNQERSSALKTINSAVESETWFSKGTLSLGGAFLTSVLANYGLQNIPQESLKKWIKSNQSKMCF